VTLLFTDIIGSTQLKQTLGDARAVTLIQRHHSALRILLGQFPEGEEIDTAGDSFFIVFAKPSDAVKFSLQVQAKLRALARETGATVFDRIGIHVGEVFTDDAPSGARSRDLFGLQVDTSARIMSLGGAHQILASRFAFDSARQVLKGEDIAGIGPLSWLNHGTYSLKGVDEPIEICEVGEVFVLGISEKKFVLVFAAVPSSRSGALQSAL
jgi:class 3 adenylate cyclase